MAGSQSEPGIATELLPQRWLVLVALIFAIFVLQFALIIMPGIAPTIIPELGLTPAQFGMLANMPYLAGVLFGVIAGNWGDRMGIKKIMNIALIVFIAGAFWRAFSNTYVMLMISSLVMGVGLAVLNANSTKAIRLWFPGKAMGVGMGLYVAGASLGAGVALKCGALWGTKLSLLVTAFSAVIVLAVWVLCYRTHPAEESDVSSTVNAGAFKEVMTNKYVWIVSILMFFMFGLSTTNQTYMNAVLGISSGGQLDVVGTLALVSTIFVALSSIFGPLLIAKLKFLRWPMVIVCVVSAITVVGYVAVSFGAGTWVLMIINTLTLGVLLAMGKTVPALLPGIDPRNLGAVGGLQSTFQNLGGWVIAGYIIAPIAQGMYPGAVDATGAMVFGMPTYIAIYAGAAICALLMGVCYALIPKNTPSHLLAEGETD